MDYGELRWSLKDDENLVLARIDINEFKETPISEEALVNLQKMFDFFRQYNKEIILRFVYDTDGNGLMNEPQSVSIIKNHMEQLGPLIRKNAGQILTLQGLFFGSLLGGNVFLLVFGIIKLFIGIIIMIPVGIFMALSYIPELYFW